MNEIIYSILKNTFGFDEFRLLQKDIIQNILSKKDTLIIMPTGSGKSLCYQLPALIFEGLTIVISPLISLMKDQVEQLREMGVPAVFLNSSLSYDEYQTNIDLILQKKVNLVYLAPEGMLTQKILTIFSKIKIDCITIDEAHCISEWGHDFRPEYRQLVEVRKLFPEAVCVALTATATPRVQKDIKDNLKFEKSNEFISSFNRENLFLQIIPKTEPVSQTLDFLKKFPDQSGIIYCFSRKQVDELSQILTEKGFSVKPYHAGLEDDERKMNQELFIQDDVQIIVATIAFGMGINKPNIRFVVHFDLPKNIESYYQQIGRAGRDGLKSHCLLLFGYGDLNKIKFFINQKEDKEKRIAFMHLDALVNFCETNICRRIPLLKYFGEKFHTEDCGMCDNCGEETKDLIDLTIHAQKFLSCMKRTGEYFGADHIIDVLRGSKSQKVLDRKHDQLSTYNIGADLSKKQWFHLSRQFLRGNLIRKDNQFGSLKITPEGWDVLKNKQTFTGSLIEEKAKFKKIKEVDFEYDQNLFEKLRQKRKEIADNNGIPPFIIFHDTSLFEMAAFFPQSEYKFMKINGVGQNKLEKYGNIFLETIRDHCREFKISEKTKAENTQYKLDNSGKKSEKEKSYSIDQIREKFPKAYEKWTEMDDELLKTSYEMDQNIKELAILFQRKPEAIRSRLKKIGLIK